MCKQSLIFGPAAIDLNINMQTLHHFGLANKTGQATYGLIELNDWSFLQLPTDLLCCAFLAIQENSSPFVAFASVCSVHAANNNHLVSAPKNSEVNVRYNALVTGTETEMKESKQ